MQVGTEQLLVLAAPISVIWVWLGTHLSQSQVLKLFPERVKEISGPNYKQA